MNMPATLAMLTDKDGESGEYRIPRIIYADAYCVGDGGLCRSGAAGHDLSRALRLHLAARPADLPSRRVRPMRSASRCVEPDRDVQALPGRAARARRALGLAGMTTDQTARRAIPATTPTTSSTIERTPGVGLLAGWRGADGERHRHRRAESRPAAALHRQRLLLACTTCPRRALLQAMPTAAIWTGRRRWASSPSAEADRDAALFRDAAEASALPPQGHGNAQPPEACAARIETYFDPLPFWYAPFEQRIAARRASRFSPSRSGRWRCITRGVRRTPGCGRSTAEPPLHQPRHGRAPGAR